MPTMTAAINGVANFDILVNGSALPPRYRAHIVALTADTYTCWPGMFEITIGSSHHMSNETEWVDDTAMFSIGNEIEVKMGYNDELETILTGEITGLEPEFSSGSLPRLVVRGYDRGHRLQRNRKTRTFTGQKDSDIASSIAMEAGLTGEVTDSQVTHDYVCQAQQTDMEFLLDRARRINYEVIIDAKKLVFRPVQNDAGEIAIISMQNDLLEFFPRLSTAGQVSEFQVRGWAPKDKMEITGQAGTGDESSTMGGASSGAQMVSSMFDGGVISSGHNPVASQAEADQLAKAQYNKAALMLITGEGTCRGRTDLKAGKVIKIEGAGTRFSGNYYLTAASHRYKARQNYTTGISFRRSGS